MEPLRAGDPERVGSFVLRGRLGAGGMGEVFLGRSPGGRSVAVKVIYPHLAAQREFRARFAREVAAAEAVSGIFTAPVVAAGPEDDPPWIATAYIPGPDLALAVTETGPLPEDSVWGLTAGLVEALQAIHAKGLLHRDLKPSNVLLASDGPKVIDFGIARTLEGSSLTRTGMVIGTPGFMSPEQAEDGQVGPASDVFALGAVIAYAATGNDPFGGGAPLAILHRVINKEPRLDTITGPLHDLITACLAKTPDERPALPQLLDQITSHWAPPDDAPGTALWPTEVTTLIHQRATTPTAPYTQHSDPTHDTPTAEELTRRHEEALHAGEAGKHAEAARLFVQVAADRARVLGDDHPDTLQSRHNHAYYLGQLGKHEEAVRLFAEVVSDYTRSLGDNHPDTLNARHNHAQEFRRVEAHIEATRLATQLAADRTLGPDHPYTLTVRHDQARRLARDGDNAEAARRLSQVAADRARVLGEDHPDTLQSRHSHAYYLGQAGEYAESARLFVQVAADRARVLGEEHPDTLQSRSGHAWNLGRAGNHVEAAHLFAEIAIDRARVLGEDHPDTLTALRSHAWNLSRVKERRS
ncbi:Serine/threonine protein kinase [Streptomyces zhaozhouensis]|uniref:Serine/threonine protein kinase n=1 Tax=Streptomyces zhaozhouensis TaxID=1300267 RepID=A0A286DW36_9ACTN|nr:serine/threonine-protein kinase [Streptomyces zhaozhouensis]SOD62830.1 Serine/threonine protein kinase [Streptomyces zhaozhouensis]